jgi:hypothetical protein
MSQFNKKCCPTVSRNVGNYTNYTDYINSQKTCNKPIVECTRGPQGPIGPTGLPGSATNTGATGPTGYEGQTGPQGVAGTATNTGATGPTGTQGATGPLGTGPTGPQGATGPQGPTGDQGATGSQGVTGSQGPTGSQGAQGVTGPQSTVTGPTGSQGAPGSPGATGFPGATGSQGPTGAQGPTGPIASGSNVAATYYSLVTQNISNSSPTIFSFPQIGYELGITKNAGNTQMIIQTTGVYEVWYSIQLHSTVSQDVYTYIWLVKNGSELADTNGRIQTKSNTSDSLPIVPYILNLNVGDTISFASQTNAANSGDIQALYVPQTIPGPDVPSIIVGIKKIAVDIGTTGPTGCTGFTGPTGPSFALTITDADGTGIPIPDAQNSNYVHYNPNTNQLTYIPEVYYVNSSTLTLPNSTASNQQLTIFNEITSTTLADYFQVGINGAGGSIPATVRAFTTDGIYVYMGGEFGTMSDGSADYTTGHVATIDSNGYINNLDEGLNGTVNVLYNNSTNSTLYAGGEFVSIVKTPFTTVNHISRYTGNPSWITMGDGTPGLSDRVNAVAKETVTNNNLYVGGRFTSNNNDSPMHYACKYSITNNTFHELAPTLPYGVIGSSNIVYAIELWGTDIYVGGSFTSAGGIPANNIARYNILTEKWSALTEVTQGATTDSYSTNGTQGPVFALYYDPSGNKLYVGGNFTSVGVYNSSAGTPTYNIVTWDKNTWSYVGTSFSQNGTNSAVYAITGDPAGNIYVGGMFTQVNQSITVDNVAQWNGSTWNILSDGSGGNGVSGPVYALLWASTSHSPGSGLYIGGNFGSVGGGSSTTLNNIVLWVASSLMYPLYENSSYPGLTGGPVKALTFGNYGNGYVIIGGEFSAYYDSGGNTQTVTYIVGWDVSNNVWYTGPSSSLIDGNVSLLNAPVSSLSFVNYLGVNYIYVGGQFTQRPYIARYETSAGTWSNVGDGFTVASYEGCLALKYYTNGSTTYQLYCGGTMGQGTTYPTGDPLRSVIPLHYVTYYNLITTTWNPMKNYLPPYGAVGGVVYAVCWDVSNNMLYVGGNFKNVGGVFANSVARYSIGAKTWEPLIDNSSSYPAIANGVTSGGVIGSGIVYALDISNNLLYVGGVFTTAGLLTGVSNLATWNIASAPSGANLWATVGTASFNGAIRTIAHDTAYIYVGGEFTSPYSGIARYNLTSWSDLVGSGTLSGSVYSLYYDSNNLYVAGNFSVGSAYNIAYWDGSIWNVIGTGTEFQGATALYAVTRNSSSGYIYVGGDFTAQGSTSNCDYISQYQGATWVQLSTDQPNNGGGPPGIVRALTYNSHNNSIYIGGDFNLIGSTFYHYIAKYNSGSYYRIPSNGSSVTCGLVPEGSSSVKCITIDKSNTDDNFIAGGAFSFGYYQTAQANTTSAENTTTTLLNNIGYWVETSQKWENLTSVSNLRLNNEANAVYCNGSDVYIGGNFDGLEMQDLTGPSSIIQSTRAYGIVRWNSTDELWYPVISTIPSIQNGVSGGTPISTVNALTSRLNDIIIGGNFQTCGGTTTNNLAFFNNLNGVVQPVTYSADIGFNNEVNTLYSASSGVYVGGNFTATGTTSSLQLGRVAKLNATTINQIVSAPAPNHIGMNNNVYSVIEVNNIAYFGGEFTASIATPPILTLNYISKFYSLTTPSSLTVTGAFLDTNNNTAYSTLNIPVKYNNASMIWNSTINKWLVTYRSTGVTLA